MIRSRNRIRSWFLFLGMLILSTTSDARKTMLHSKGSSANSLHTKNPKRLKEQKHLTSMEDISILESSNTQPYISSPLSWPPFDTLPPDNSPPNYILPTSPTGPSLPGPGPPVVGLSPPYFEPSPPGPDTYIPSPPAVFVPSPVVFQPPVVYPPPAVPPPRSGTGDLWCVVKPDVPDPIIQEAVNYACGTGADCGPIQTNGLCFQPNTLIFHASFAFNSYWQRTKVAGGTCSFGGIAILVTMDPSHDGCRFDYF